MASRSTFLAAAVAVAGVVTALGAGGVAAESVAALRVSSSGQIAYPGNGKIYLINSNGTDQRVLVSGGTQYRVDHWGGIAWSRDGTQIAFTVGDHRAGVLFGDTLQLYVAAADGANARRLKGAPRGAFYPTWSPDGSQIAFSTRGDSGTSIAVIGVDGEGLRTLASSTKPQDFYWAPDWSPDGAWILFEINPRHALHSRLMAIRPDGTGLHEVAAFDTDTHCICADWSPDGKRIAYQAPTPPRYDYPEIWVMNADGSGRVQLTRNRPRDENPDWSPDGRRIAFYSERNGDAEIYVIPAVGGQARRVTRDRWYNGAPRWRPTANANRS